MRFLKGPQLALVSPMVLAAACALLTLIIGVFAINNYRREKILMTNVLLERGATLIRFVTSGARASFLDGIRRGITPSQWSEHTQDILERAAEHPGVHFLALIDHSGKILASSRADEINTHVDPETLAFLNTINQEFLDLGKFRYRVGGRNQPTAFQVAALFVPIGKRQFEQLTPPFRGIFPRPEGIGQMMARRHHLLTPEWTDELERISEQRYVILVELDLEQLNKAVRQQLLQIVILSVILLLVGTGGWLSLLTLEGLKGSQSRLNRIKAFRDTLISSLPVGLIVTDNQGLILLCNQFAEQIASVTEKEVIGLAPEKVLPPELAHALDPRKMTEAGLIQEETTLSDHRGEPRTLLLHGMSVVDSEGAPTGMMLLIQDLTQVKSLEEELRRSERMAALGKMAAGVAHELRNPLSSIKGLALLLKSRFQEKSQDQETANILVQEVERLNRSIGELLDYTRSQKLIKGAVHPEEVVAEALLLLRMDAESMRVETAVRVTGEIPVIQADQDKLKQVFLNLFLNSIQAMEHGGKLDIRITKEGEGVCIVVTDTGCGVSQDDLHRVFDPYFTTKAQGTGLGLAMSAKIIQEHGGTITLHGEADRGTTVTVTLPICQPEND